MAATRSKLFYLYRRLSKDERAEIGGHVGVDPEYCRLAHARDSFEEVYAKAIMKGYGNYLWRRIVELSRDE